MKYAIFLLFICACISCTSTKQFASTDPVPYKIKKIESNDFAYFIYAQRNDSTFRIISLKDSFHSDLDTVKVGNKYQLNLIKIYPNDLVEKDVDDARIDAIDGCMLFLNKKEHYSLYTANNLKGLEFYNYQHYEDSIVNRFSIATFFCDACKKKLRFFYFLYVK